MLASPVEAARLIGKLEAGDQVYYNVRVQEVLPDAIIIRHSRGIAKVPLADLSEAWQAQFNYDPEKAAAYRAYLEKQEQDRRAAAEAQRQATVQRKKAAPTGPTLADQVLPLFGTEPVLQERVDLRPQFREMGFYAKNQGRRPSCAIFSVVSALEYQQGRNSGQPTRLSEEYLIWATRKSLGLAQTPVGEDELSGDADLGFNLMEVVQALRAYGIADAEDLPNTFGSSTAEIAEPPAETIDKARNRRQVEAYWVSGRTPEDQLNGLFHLLNSGVPVVIGMGWPNYATVMRSPLIDRQNPRPGAGHAVTLVGYKCETGKPEDALFQFKNSWGPRWGNGGYGWVSWEYLRKNLQSAVFLDCE
ncbi:MAG: C1 family peptidase [Verrucomicrobiota bacterium JB024]|nr:C1 family peptidase [Verrucomicrobiota bacterium JB024]